MGSRAVLAILCGTLLFASICGRADDETVGKGQQVREGRIEPALKGWREWAQGKLGRGSETQLPHDQTSVAARGWSDWAFQKISSFSGRASKEAEKATQAGKEKVREEGKAAAKEGQDLWEEAKEGSGKAKDYAGMAKEGMSEKVKEYAAGKAREMSHEAGKAYEASKDLGNQATQRVAKEDAEL